MLKIFLNKFRRSVKKFTRSSISILIFYMICTHIKKLKLKGKIEVDRELSKNFSQKLKSEFFKFFVKPRSIMEKAYYSFFRLDILENNIKVLPYRKFPFKGCNYFVKRLGKK